LNRVIAHITLSEFANDDANQAAILATEVVLPGLVEPAGLQIRERRLTEPAANQALVKIEATGVSFAEQGMRRGGYPGQPAFPFVPGYDFVGTVLAVGTGVGQDLIGKRVAAVTKTGGWATHVLVLAQDLVPVPPDLDPALVETVLVNGITAWQMLYREARVKPGQTILLHGANGTRVYYRMPAAGAKTPEPDSRIIERDLSSGHERNVLSGHLGHLRPSPDGRYAVLRQLDAAGKWVAMRLLPLANARPATDLMRADGNASLFFSFWAPDSRSVVLRMPENGQPTSWWVPLEGQQQKALSRFVGSAAVHPNGTTIAFAASGG
jgi:hypothetical protein